MKLPPPPTTARVRISFWRLSGAVVWHTAQLA